VSRSLAIGHELGLKRDGMPQTFPRPVSRSGLAASRRSATFNMSAAAELFDVAVIQPTSAIRARSSKAVGLHPAREENVGTAPTADIPAPHGERAKAIRC
jgi:hypothetical protein